MKPEYEKLPFRPNVCLITLKKDRFLLVSRINWPVGFWKFPQGGIDAGEDLLEAGKREFLEEVGSNNMKIIGVSKYENLYDWDDKGIENKNKRWRGQAQRFLVVEFLGEESDIKIDPEELKDHKWVSREEIINYSKDPEHNLFRNYNGFIGKVFEEFSI
jgi:putative (di)nucleoside polyphosphate hydrolase